MSAQDDDFDFDLYLAERMQDPEFAEAFRLAEARFAARHARVAFKRNAQRYGR